MSGGDDERQVCLSCHRNAPEFASKALCRSDVPDEKTWPNAVRTPGKNSLGFVIWNLVIAGMTEVNVTKWSTG